MPGGKVVIADKGPKTKKESTDAQLARTSEDAKVKGRETQGKWSTWVQRFSALEEEKVRLRAEEKRRELSKKIQDCDDARDAGGEVDPRCPIPPAAGVQGITEEDKQTCRTGVDVRRVLQENCGRGLDRSPNPCFNETLRELGQTDIKEAIKQRITGLQREVNAAAVAARAQAEQEQTLRKELKEVNINETRLRVDQQAWNKMEQKLKEQMKAAKNELEGCKSENQKVRDELKENKKELEKLKEEAEEKTIIYNQKIKKISVFKSTANAKSYAIEEKKNEIHGITQSLTNSRGEITRLFDQPPATEDQLRLEAEQFRDQLGIPVEDFQRVAGVAGPVERKDELKQLLLNTINIKLEIQREKGQVIEQELDSINKLKNTIGILESGSIKEFKNSEYIKNQTIDHLNKKNLEIEQRGQRNLMNARQLISLQLSLTVAHEDHQTKIKNLESNLSEKMNQIERQERQISTLTADANRLRADLDEETKTNMENQRVAIDKAIEEEKTRAKENYELELSMERARIDAEYKGKLAGLEAQKAELSQTITNLNNSLSADLTEKEGLAEQLDIARARSNNLDNQLTLEKEKKEHDIHKAVVAAREEAKKKNDELIRSKDNIIDDLNKKYELISEENDKIKTDMGVLVQQLETATKRIQELETAADLAPDELIQKVKTLRDLEQDPVLRSQMSAEIQEALNSSTQKESLINLLGKIAIEYQNKAAKELEERIKVQEALEEVKKSNDKLIEETKQQATDLSNERIKIERLEFDISTGKENLTNSIRVNEQIRAEAKSATEVFAAKVKIVLEEHQKVIRQLEEEKRRAREISIESEENELKYDLLKRTSDLAKIENTKELQGLQTEIGELRELAGKSSEAINTLEDKISDAQISLKSKEEELKGANKKITDLVAQNQVSTMLKEKNEKLIQSLRSELVGKISIKDLPATCKKNGFIKESDITQSTRILNNRKYIKEASITAQKIRLNNRDYVALVNKKCPQAYSQPCRRKYVKRSPPRRKSIPPSIQRIYNKKYIDWRCATSRQKRAKQNAWTRYRNYIVRTWRRYPPNPHSRHFKCRRRCTGSCISWKNAIKIRERQIRSYQSALNGVVRKYNGSRGRGYKWQYTRSARRVRGTPYYYYFYYRNTAYCRSYPRGRCRYGRYWRNYYLRHSRSWLIKHNRLKNAYFSLRSRIRNYQAIISRKRREISNYKASLKRAGFT